MANIELNKDFVAAVESGKKVWRKADFDAINISKEMKKEAGIVDCPRWEGWTQGTGDGVHLNVNGIEVVCYGTSNMTSDEKRYYYDHKGSGTGTPRSTATSTVVEKIVYDREHAIALLKTFKTVNMEQAKMFLNLAGASEMAQNLLATRDDWTIEQIEMLMNMNDF